MSAASRRIGILAGGGSLPVEFANSANARGELAHIVSIEGPGDERFAGLPVTGIGMGEVGRMLRAFRTAGARDIVIIGPARRPDLTRIKPDLGFFRHLPSILKILASGGDDGVLSGVVRFFESQGFRVLGPEDVAPETLVPEGLLAGPAPSVEGAGDIQLGLAIIRLLGDLDVGQAVIAGHGRIEAIEGAEGTDRMLARIAEVRRLRQAGADSSGVRRGFLIKRPKPGQELRVDMPSIGPGSVTASLNAALGGIAVQAGKVLVAERDEVIRLANESGLTVTGIRDDEDPPARPASSGSFALRRLGRHSHGARDSEDLRLAWELAQRLATYDCGHCTVVAKRYVLAVEAGGEGAMSVLSRVAEGRSRGRKRARRSGAALIMRPDEVTGETVGVLSEAGLSGFAVGSAGRDVALGDGVISAADKAGLFVVSLAR